MLRTCSYILLFIGVLMPSLTWGQVFPIKVDRKWGLVDGQGKMVASPVYEAIHNHGLDHAIVVKDGKYGLLSSGGKLLIPPQYTFLKPYNDDLMLINEGGDCENGDCSGGKWGLIHLENGNRLPPQFDLIGKFNGNGLALVNTGGNCDYQDCEGGQWGIVDTLGVLRVPARYQQVRIANVNEAFLQSEKGWGMFNLVRDQMMIPPIYGELQRVGTNRVTMKTQNKYGVLTDQGDTLIAPRYDGIVDAGRGYLSYQEGRKFGLMDSVGQHHTTARFDLVKVGPHGWVKVMDQGMWGLVDMQDREIIGPVLRAIGHLGPDYAAVQRGPRWGMVDAKGGFFIQDKYESLQVINDSVYLVKEKKYHKWLNRSGQITKALLFDEMSDWSHNVARVRMGKHWGLINKAGTWIAPPRFSEVRNYFMAGKGRRKGKWGYFYYDEEGNPSKVKRLVLLRDEGEEDMDEIMGTISSVGWFFSNTKQSWGLRHPQTNRILLPPQFDQVELVPGTNVTAVSGKVGEGVEMGWGMVDHVRGQVLTEPLFGKIYTEDFLVGTTARASYAQSGRFALVGLSGEVVNFDKAAYIGRFINGMARINLGGYLEWTRSGGMDTLAMERVRDRRAGRMVIRYQYCRQGQWGFINREGKMVCPATYETALDFENGLARIRKGGKWGVLNTNFQVVVEPKYDFIENLYSANGTILLTVGVDRNEYGFIDENGEIAILPKFTEVGEFREGLVRVQQDGRWGYADKQGNIVIQPQYVEAGDFYEGRARIRNKRYWGYIDREGRPLTGEKFLRAGDFKESLAWVQVGKFFGYLNLAGELFIPAVYTEVGDFSEGLAPAKRKGNYGLIDTIGRWVVAPRFYRIQSFHDSLAVVQDGGNFGMVNPKGELVVRPVYRQLGDFSEGLAVVREKLEFGYVDRTGQMKIPCQYANAGPFSCGLAAVFVNGKWGFVDTTGTQRVENRFSKVRPFQEDRAAVRLGSQWGFVDPLGRIAVPVTFDQVGDFEAGRAAVYIENAGWGFVNADGTRIVPCRYEAVGAFRNGLVPVKQGGKWGLINEFGAQVTLLKYDELRGFREGLAPALLKRKVGVVNADGKVLIPPSFDTVKRVNDRIRVEAADAIGYIDPDGNWIWEPSK